MNQKAVCLNVVFFFQQRQDCLCKFVFITVVLTNITMFFDLTNLERNCFLFRI